VVPARRTLCRVPRSALGKGTDKGVHCFIFVECQAGRHSVKKLPLSNASLHLSAQRMLLGPTRAFFFRVPGERALGKGSLFAECLWVHSAMSLSPSLVAVTTNFLSWAPNDTYRRLCWVLDKKDSTKEPLLIYNSLRPLCRPRVTLDKDFAKSFLGWNTR
jgi:hypothetical protein